MKNKIKYLIAIALVVIFSSSLVVSASAEGEVTDVAVEPEGNFFTVAYEELSAYASEILCGLTLAASLILAFAYKKGLLPLVQSALVSIGNAVTKIGDSAKKSEEQTALLEENIGSSIKNAKDMIGALTEKISSLDNAVNERLVMDEKARGEYEKLRFIIEGQIDMLYDIFMSSALPQYQKDAVGERIGKMKGMVAKDDSAE